MEKDYVTEEQYEQIRTDAASKKATVAADEAALDRAQLELSWTTIAAPVTGRTGQLLVHAGNVVKANDAPLVVIQQIEPVDVSFSVAQTSLDEIRARSAAGTLSARATPPGGAGHEGELTFIDNAVDPATGTIQLKATFPNHDRALWPGQFVNVTSTWRSSRTRWWRRPRRCRPASRATTSSWSATTRRSRPARSGWAGRSTARR